MTKPMYNFCTLFDSNYLSRGLAMYESLAKQCNNFHLYIYTFDDLSHVLSEHKLCPEVDSSKSMRTLLLQYQSLRKDVRVQLIGFICKND